VELHTKVGRETSRTVEVCEWKVLQLISKKQDEEWTGLIWLRSDHWQTLVKAKINLRGPSNLRNSFTR
jgi:hypothetical protein